MIFYESPYRLAATIENMITVFGAERSAVICRELTKIHEEYLRGSLKELLDYLGKIRSKESAAFWLRDRRTLSKSFMTEALKSK